MKIKAAHTSLNTFATRKQKKEDLFAIFDRAVKEGYWWITGTEAGPGSGYTRRNLPRIAKKHGYVIAMGEKSDTWIAVDGCRIQGGLVSGNMKLIPGAKAVKDPHPYSQKNLTWIRWNNSDLGAITVGAFHLLTKGSKPGQAQKDKPGDPVDHFATNENAIEEMGLFMRKRVSREGLGFLGGDANRYLRNEESFREAGFTCAWDEVRSWPNTGHGCIDGQFRWNSPRRSARAVKARALNDEKFALNSDHYLIEATYLVEQI